MATIARTGWTVDSLPDLADGPAMIKELADQVAPDIGAPTFANVAALPSTGNYAGRLAWTTSGAGLYRHSGSAWVRLNPFYGSGTVSFDSGGNGLLTHGAGFLPSRVHVQPWLGSTGILVVPGTPPSINTTTVWLHAWLISTGAAFSGSITTVDYMVVP